MTLMLSAIDGEITSQIKTISKIENVDKNIVLRNVSSGKIVILSPKIGSIVVALGEGMRSKVLCNLGTSSESPDIKKEIQKAKIAAERGASIICDQSVGPNVFKNRKKLVKAVNLPIASVPLYQTAEEAHKYKGNPLDFNSDDLLSTFEIQIQNGTTVPGIYPLTKDLNLKIKKSKRIMPTISRGGTIISAWIDEKKKENPYIENYDKILEICIKYDIPLTFVCSCRSGCIEDGFDEIQIYEWKIIRELTEKAHKKGVGIIVDGLGHMSMEQIPNAVKTFKEICYGVPLGVMGPVPTDRALGHEHIANAIGSAIAVYYGANYCQACARTEHLGLPDIDDLPDAIGASVIATYIGDLARSGGKFREVDKKMAEARKENQWGIQLSLALEKKGAKETFDRVGPKNKNGEGCSICGDLCPFTMDKHRK